MGMSGTKVAGWLILVGSILYTAADLLNGGTFDFMQHKNDIYAALLGVGMIRGRIAIQKAIDQK